MVAPAKIVVGTSTADLAGREGEVMRKMLPYIIVLVAIDQFADLSRCGDRFSRNHLIIIYKTRKNEVIHE